MARELWVEVCVALCLAVLVDAGSRYEVHYTSGLSHFLQRLAFQVGKVGVAFYYFRFSLSSPPSLPLSPLSLSPSLSLLSLPPPFLPLSLPPFRAPLSSRAERLFSQRWRDMVACSTVRSFVT